MMLRKTLFVCLLCFSMTVACSGWSLAKDITREEAASVTFPKGSIRIVRHRQGDESEFNLPVEFAQTGAQMQVG